MKNLVAIMRTLLKSEAFLIQSRILRCALNDGIGVVYKRDFSTSLRYAQNDRGVETATYEKAYQKGRKL